MPRLRDDLFWCLCGGRPVFLDIRGDRYFLLPPEAQAAFLRLTRGEHESGDAEALAPLTRKGLLREGPGDLAGSPQVETPAGDILEHQASGAGAIDLVRAAACEIIARWQVRRRPLSALLGKVKDGGTDPGSHVFTEAARLEPLLAAFSTADLLFPRTDRCLPHALAVHAACRHAGVRPRLVFGVRLDPFAAHAWLQLGDRVVVGEYEQVRLFTPIAAFP